MRAFPPIARLISSNPESYEYLAESIRDWPGQDELAHLIADQGFDAVQYRNLSGGIVAIHRGRKPASA
jgi:demethylmenaquinone methyltransferase/2-methoxy-6-polyprenyl-1,4-benzoquinol methylase